VLNVLAASNYNLPFILAGPIVRRTTPERVHVWLATSRVLDNPHLVLYASNTASTDAIPTEPEWYPVVLGKHLFIYLLVAKPRKPLTPGRIYAYDICQRGIRSIFSVEELQHIVLKGFSLPSFVVGQTTKPAMRALYGSCRKLHGPQPDMMIAAEKVLNDASPSERPEYLFLGGDQIYADDVHPAFLNFTYPLRIMLFGQNERIPGLDPRARSLHRSRAAYLSKFFTSTHMDHHLLTLGEYVSAYLLAWNGKLWSWLRRFIDEDTIQQPGLQQAFLGALQARRVLANIVTYMIFDDHEITDDWFLNKEWTTRAEKSRPALQILTNGLVAYWAFQGWGNDPDAFDDHFRDLMSDYSMGFGRSVDSTWTALARTRWSFMAPTSPPTLFLDTRTKRESSKAHMDPVRSHNQYQDKGNFFLPQGPDIPILPFVFRNSDAPRLLDAEERAHIDKLRRTHVAEHTPFVVIAPAPVFGFPPLEWIQERVGAFNPAVADLESWAANVRNICDAVTLFTGSRPEPLIVLSGDVHYGFEIVGRITKYANATLNYSIPFVQLCSSGFKNEPVGKEAHGLKISSHFGRKDRAYAYWDLRKKGSSDGPVARSEAESLTTKAFLNAYGVPSFLVESRFVRRPDRPSSRLAPRNDRIEWTNNLGQLVISENAVSHRHWSAQVGGGFEAREYISWTTSAWPIKGPIEQLVDYVFDSFEFR
jgi:hypothetical protein